MTAKMSAINLRRRAFKVLTLIMAFATLFNISAFAEGTTAVSQTTDKSFEELQSEYEKIENEIAKNEQKLDKVEDKINDQKEVVNDIYSQMSATQKQIDVLTNRVNILNTDIKNTNSQINIITRQLSSLSEQIEATGTAIEEKNTAMEETYELLKMRIRAMYMAGNGSTFEFILSSEDFSTLMTRTELLVRVAQHDNDLIATYEDDIAELEALEETLNGSVKEQETKKSDLDKKVEELDTKKADADKAGDKLNEKKQELSKQSAQAKSELNKLDKESQAYKDTIDRWEDELIEISKQMEQYIRDNGSSTTDKNDKEEKTTKAESTTKKDDSSSGGPSSSSKGMIFPLKYSGVYISSPYGMRIHPITGNKKMHTGVDLTAGGINKQPIYAVKDGTVIYAQVQSGYGNFIIIDHGDGISTCYAHCDSIAVSYGQKVTQGQLIGRVGSTGNSTGPHLHFEVRVNGSTVNPMNYIKLPS